MNEKGLLKRGISRIDLALAVAAISLVVALLNGLLSREWSAQSALNSVTSELGSLKIEISELRTCCETPTVDISRSTDFAVLKERVDSLETRLREQLNLTIVLHSASQLDIRRQIESAIENAVKRP